MNTHRRHRRGFTLIELLVVISIMSLLMAILVPSLSKARKTARRTKCLTQLRDVFVATCVYIQDDGWFPPLNHEEEEGAWQYNYLIYDDDEDFDFNFGPLARPNGIIQYIEELYCPVQRDPYHRLATDLNPWPVQKGYKTRAAYGRRFGLSGKTLSQIRWTIAFAADVLHLPSAVLSAHKTGLNVVYTDGHARWVRAPDILLHNTLSKPFVPENNPIVAEIWYALDRTVR